MKTRILLLPALLVFALLFGILGCNNGGGNANNLAGPVPNSIAERGDSSVGIAQSVSFRIVLPGQNSMADAPATSLMPAIKASALASVSVTFKLILVNVGNTAQPTTTLTKTVPVNASGSAQVAFTAVPALTCIGDVHIDGGKIDSYTDFHGAIDLETGIPNILEAAPKGSRLRQDFVAYVIEQIVARPSLFGKAVTRLAARVIQAIAGLDLAKPTAYEDAVSLFENLTDVVIVITTSGATNAINLGGGQVMTFVNIPQGTFTMGSPDTEAERVTNEGPQHQVTLSAFSMATTETTQAQYQAVMGTNPSSSTGDLARPVEQVSWWDAVRFANKVSLNNGFTACYTNAAGSSTIVDTDVLTCNWSANGLRLPTEAEWEYACRASTTSSFYWGDSSEVSVMGQYAWYESNSNYITQPVGGKTKNAFGLYDMSGNVGEWCWDWYGSYSSTGASDPKGPDTGAYRILRGFGIGWHACRSAFRGFLTPFTRSNASTGFRLVRLSRTQATGDYTSANIGLLKYVPGGTFQRDSTPSNTTTVSAFRMRQYEITQTQFTAVTGLSNPSSFTAVVSGPVERVNWYHALVFCNKLSMKEGMTPAYTIGASSDPTAWGAVPTTASSAVWDTAICNWSANGYRLPTEAEWQWAAMGATNSPSKVFSGSTGSNLMDNYAWYLTNSGNTTHSVGGKTANELGIYDMSGNVSEWCWDLYDSYPAGAQTNPRGAISSTYRALRGGSWHYAASSIPVASRYSGIPYNQAFGVGIRVVRQ
ncbi:MAG: SUMF1/EgtB/PvdO family nonheme iron enzyme [Candidatus Ozemobacteraceae bacterium]